MIEVLLQGLRYFHITIKKTFTNQTYWSPIEPILIDTSKQFLREAIIHIICNITKKRVGFSFEAS